MIFYWFPLEMRGLYFLQKFFGKCGGVLDFWMCVIYDENI